MGIDIDMYNKNQEEGRWYYQQKEINNAMPILAHTVNFINKAEELVGPWITGSIHDYKNHKLYHRYAKLKDGLHPRDALKDVWAGKFTKAIVKNYNKFQL